MAGRDERSTKERIQSAAIELFARKGFGATGVREIATEAGVSLAMINYHYGSKAALLESILEDFFRTMREALGRNLAGDDPPEDKLRRHLRWAVEYYRSRPELVRVAIVEFPHDIPGLVHLKAERVRDILGLVIAHLMPDLPEAVRSRIRLEVAGPALMGSLVFHFLMRPVAEDAFGIRFDDTFYEGFADALADLLLYGVLGLADAPARGGEG